MAATPPSGAIQAFALLAGLVAFMSASQDVVVDAYRTDLLAAAERGLGSSFNVLGYRLAMILSGGITLIWVDPAQGGGWTWPEVYRFMALLMVAVAVFSADAAAAHPRRRRARSASPATTSSASSPWSLRSASVT
jgi:PAT family beta-lactamase induction signal transducer AmpG